MVDKLSSRIRQAKEDHSNAYPDGDWLSVNERLSLLFWEAFPILQSKGIDPWAGGNSGRADKLEDIGL